MSNIGKYEAFKDANMAKVLMLASPSFFNNDFTMVFTSNMELVLKVVGYL